MSGANQGFPIPNFPGVGYVGTYAVGGPSGYVAQVLGDQTQWVGGYLLFSLLSEARVQTQLLYQLLGTETTQLSQLRADAIADMGTLYATNPVAPVPSS
jgi:hypothetical protein